jgi:hypothetical protein
MPNTSKNRLSVGQEVFSTWRFEDWAKGKIESIDGDDVTILLDFAENDNGEAPKRITRPRYNVFFLGTGGVPDDRRWHDLYPFCMTLKTVFPGDRAAAIVNVSEKGEKLNHVYRGTVRELIYREFPWENESGISKGDWPLAVIDLDPETDFYGVEVFEDESRYLFPDMDVPMPSSFLVDTWSKDLIYELFGYIPEIHDTP